jgi:hypothetical protein
VALAASVLFALWCGTRAQADGILMPNYYLGGGIETDKTIYSLGETVWVTGRLINTLNVDVTFHALAQGVDFSIIQNGNTVFEPYHFITDEPFEKTLSPGEVLERTFSWDMTYSQGWPWDAGDPQTIPVSPGQYEVHFKFDVGTGLPGSPPSSLIGFILAPSDLSTSITIIPEPVATPVLLIGLGVTCLIKRRIPRVQRPGRFRA